MKLLILGGTVFLGRAIVDAALAQGHDVTLFNRGKSDPDLFPTVAKLAGDRLEGNLSALEGSEWDAVIDTCGYVPRVVKQSAETIKTRHYTFISTISVYSDYLTVDQDESGELGTHLDDPTTEVVDGATYGPLKVLCEQAAEAALPGRVLHVRSGLIVGPYDRSDRFTYWPVRIQKGGDILAPGLPKSVTQFIDVRDQAEWIIRSIENDLTGIFNVTGLAAPLPMGDLFDACKEVTQSDATFTWVEDDFLSEQKVGAYTEVPLWVPGNMTGFSRFNISKAVEAGLTFRPIKTTIADTLSFANSRPDDYEWRNGLSAERETDLLRLWREQNKQ